MSDMVRLGFVVLLAMAIVLANGRPTEAVISSASGERQLPAGVESAALGDIRRERLGIVMRDLTSDLADAVGLRETGGVVVTQVAPESTAAAAGIQVGDVILAINRRPISGTEALRSQASLMTIGAAVELTVWRDGKRQTVRAWLARPERGVRAHTGDRS